MHSRVGHMHTSKLGEVHPSKYVPMHTPKYKCILPINFILQSCLTFYTIF